MCLSSVSVFFAGFFSLMYFQNKDFFIEIDLWIAVVIHDLVFNFNWHLLTFLNRACWSSSLFIFKKILSKESQNPSYFHAKFLLYLIKQRNQRKKNLLGFWWFCLCNFFKLKGKGFWLLIVKGFPFSVLLRSLIREKYLSMKQFKINEK